MPLSSYLAKIREKLGPDLLLVPAVCGLVFNDAGEILLGQRSDTGRWAVIGGMIDPDEQPADAVVREVFEETAVVVRPERITGVYLTPIITYADGNRAQYVITTFRCRPISGTPRVNDSESLDIRYFSTHELPADLGPQHRLRIEHAMQNGHTFFQPAKPTE